MSLSSFCVVSNALRLNLVKLYQGTENTGEVTVITALEIGMKKRMRK